MSEEKKSKEELEKQKIHTKILKASGYKMKKRDPFVYKNF